MPLPASISNSFNRTLFHLAKEFTTTAFLSSKNFTGKFTVLYIPFKSSLIPVPSNTISGDEIFTRFKF